MEARGRAAYRADLQSQFAVVQLRYTLEPSPQTRGALINLLRFWKNMVDYRNPQARTRYNLSVFSPQARE
ncbi:hypothetical protein RIF25_16090 [Thermosynechococcaceae cyanobacterium BACA0444]|uniref:Uncharacterized protein n=1 Tax=Pseudocalidococcus azoricus BACA0444 TaxID=2918990 RepID=A0AAE4FUA7_9CYAN|nr:hypothetical protein [Pseudocalidococcus azoricus]MDS3862321.1 hypothetical protein [Pseudocalidococcus azoricus BACA0444]